MAQIKGPIGVAILTTSSVVAIQRILEETESDQSVMCVDFRSQVTGVSADYHRFLAPGTGVLSKIVGNSVFRMDVDGPVDRGNSFQLAVFFAHVLHRAGNLAGTESEPPAEIVVATGAVNVKYAVKAVTDIGRKLAVLDAWLLTRTSQCPVRLLLPHENYDHAAAALSQLAARGVIVEFLKSVAGMVEPTGIENPEPDLPPLSMAAPGLKLLREGAEQGTSASPELNQERPGPEAEPHRSLTRRYVAMTTGGIAVATVLVAAALLAWNGGEIAPTGPAAGPGLLPVRVTVVDVGSTSGCYGGERTTHRYEARSGGELVVDPVGIRCRLEARGVTDQGQAQHVYLVAQNGRAMPPVYLGPNGALLPQLLTDQDVLELAFAPDFPLPALDVSTLPRIVVRLASARAD